MSRKFWTVVVIIVAISIAAVYVWGALSQLQGVR